MCNIIRVDLYTREQKIYRNCVYKTIQSYNQVCVDTDTDNYLYTWGKDCYGRLGSDSVNKHKIRLVPNRPELLPPVNRYFIGHCSIMAISKLDRCYIWGYTMGLLPTDFIGIPVHIIIPYNIVNILIFHLYILLLSIYIPKNT